MQQPPRNAPPPPPERNKPKRSRTFTPEFKAGAVQLVSEGGRTFAQAAAALGVSKSCIIRWVREAKVERGNGPPGAVTSNEREELSRLRKEVKVLRMEREILKKAAAFFAKENG